MCGEKPGFWLMMSDAVGSPPRVRGKALLYFAFGKRYGITPACAGKSGKAKVVSSVVKDHPRVCGEKVPNSLFIRNHIGSPPRVRGKAWVLADDVGCSGITPACAGKSTALFRLRQAVWDHPRVCGEKW